LSTLKAKLHELQNQTSSLVLFPVSFVFYDTPNCAIYASEKSSLSPVHCSIMAVEHRTTQTLNNKVRTDFYTIYESGKRGWGKSGKHETNVAYINMKNFPI